jgi:hypothetical protein
VQRLRLYLPWMYGAAVPVRYGVHLWKMPQRNDLLK